MASLRRSRVLSPDGQTAKFLYTIIKQLDLKAIDWNEVASGLDITNGHAARMRYSRFKAQIEGLPTQSKPRAPRPKNVSSAATKGKGKNKPGYEPGNIDDLKGEDDDGDVKMERGNLGIKTEGSLRIKQEDSVTVERMNSSAAFDTIHIKPEPGPKTETSVPQEYLAIEVKQEPVVEPANYNLSPASGIAAMDINSYSTPPPTPTISTLAGSSGPVTPTNTFPQYQAIPTMPPHATVSLADLQLLSIPRPTGQMPLPKFSYPLMPMEFDFDFNAPILSPRLQPAWQPQVNLSHPVTVKREMDE